MKTKHKARLIAGNPATTVISYSYRGFQITGRRRACYRNSTSLARVTRIHDYGFEVGSYYGGGEVRVEFRSSPELAAKVAALVKEEVDAKKDYERLKSQIAPPATAAANTR